MLLVSTSASQDSVAHSPQPLNMHKHQHGHMIKTIDNFLNETEAAMVARALADCPWFLTNDVATVSAQKYLSMKDDHTREYLQFCHHMMDDAGNVISPQYSYLIDFFKHKFRTELAAKTFFRMKANLQTQCAFSQEEFYNTPHLDRPHDPTHLAAIYYVNDSDGDTLFFRQDQGRYQITHSIGPRAGRLVLFDGHTYHSGRHPKSAATRVLINFNFA
jgi:hypothetical protein